MRDRAGDERPEAFLSSDGSAERGRCSCARSLFDPTSVPDVLTSRMLRILRPDDCVWCVEEEDDRRLPETTSCKVGSVMGTSVAAVADSPGSGDAGNRRSSSSSFKDDEVGDEWVGDELSGEATSGIPVSASP